MHNLSKIEEYYKKFTTNLERWLPDGFIEINLKLLSKLGLMDFHKNLSEEDTLTQYFHVVETKEKITLISDEFIVWIVPNLKMQSTNIFVALNKSPQPHLETAFFASGVYNTSYLVLKVLEEVLNDIHENEEIIQSYQEAI